jgi:hypothetical protein
MMDDSEGLRASEFPELIHILKSNTARHWARSDDYKLAADFVRADLEVLGLFVDSLEFHYSAKGDEERGGVATYLLSAVPGVDEHVL